MTTMKNYPIEHVMEQIEGRMKAPATSQLDIYVWSDGRVTGPPTGDEPDDARLVTLVTPTGGVMPSTTEIRATITKGVMTAEEAPEEVIVGAAGLEEIEPAEAHSPNGQPQG